MLHKKENIMKNGNEKIMTKFYKSNKKFIVYEEQILKI